MTNEVSERELLQRHDDIKNKHHAKLGMVGVSVFLFANMFLSSLMSRVLAEFIYSRPDYFQSFVVGFLGIFGVGKTVALSAAKNLLASVGFSEFTGMILSVVTLVLPAFVISKFFRLSSSESFPLKGKTVKHFLPVFGTMQLFVYFTGSLSTGIYNGIFPDSTTDPGGFTDFSGVVFDLFSIIIRFLSVCVFVPLIEEYVFRGVIFSCLKKYGTLYATVASAVIFGIAHSNPAQSVYALTFGLFSCFLVAVTGNIRTSVLFHAINNFLSILNEQLVAYASPSVYSAVNGGIYFATAFLGFAGLYFIAEKGGLCDDFSEICKKENENKIVLPGVGEIFVFPVIIYILIYGANVIIEAI